MFPASAHKSAFLALTPPVATHVFSPALLSLLVPRPALQELLALHLLLALLLLQISADLLLFQFAAPFALMLKPALLQVMAVTLVFKNAVILFFVPPGKSVVMPLP